MTSGRTRRVLVAWTLVTATAAVAIALGNPLAAQDGDDVGNVPYDGRFTFARLRYTMGGFGDGFFGGFRRRDPPWAHDYPRAERNLMKILREVTLLAPYEGPNGGNVFALDDPDLFKYPLAYMSEPGFWTLTDEQERRFREYLLKGGFVIFDDFRGRHWANFEAQVARVLPDARLVELDVEHPIFHAFFEIETLDFVQMYDRYEPARFYGVFEGNDPAKRLLLVANYNNDIGEYWEYSDTGYVPIDLSNEAYKLGVNYIVYSMTH